MNKDVRLRLVSGDTKSSQHVALERLVELLLAGTPLSDSEHFHLMHCNECTQTMMQAAGSRLKGPGDSIN
jgi:hypothetical protein